MQNYVFAVENSVCGTELPHLEPLLSLLWTTRYVAGVLEAIIVTAVYPEILSLSF